MTNAKSSLHTLPWKQAQGLRHSSNRQASNGSVQYTIYGMTGRRVEIYLVLARRLPLLLA